MDITDRAEIARPGEEIDVNVVQSFLKIHIPDLDNEIQIFQFPSGYSNLTYLIVAGDRQWVLRRPPVGADITSGHDMAREYKVLTSLYRVFPRCPRPLAFTEDTSLIGSPFFIMEKLSGIILRKDLPKGFSYSPDQARRLCENLVDTLVDIHSIDMKAADLDSIGRPQGYVQRQVHGWTERYGRAKTPDAPDFESVMAWLADKMPKDTDTPSMVHNDYKIDNLVLSPDHPEKITGILDWEMATYGDPLMDLGKSLAYWVEKDDPQDMQLMRTMPTNMDGALTRKEILERYARKTGRDTDQFDFYYCFGLFRLAVIAQQIYNRYYRGITKNKRFAMLIFGVTALEKAAKNLMESSRL